MRAFSFVQNGYGLDKVELEISLVPGLPGFHVTGLPDTAIRESLLRVKSALRNQDFELPTRQQVLFHIRPANIKKTSLGIDLAFAALYLMKTGQVPLLADEICIYGGLTLDGDVLPAEDDDWIDFALGGGAVSGAMLFATGTKTTRLHATVGRLRDLLEPKWVEGEFDAGGGLVRPEIPDIEFGETAANAMAIAAAGEHHVFLAGPAGSGKTTFADALWRILPALSEDRRFLVGGGMRKAEHRWRAFLAPHHSTTAQALLGGGLPIVPGDVTHATGGILLLDEFLEFPAIVKEALREPLESRKITLSRKGQSRTFPADFMCVATTNLCPCGDFVPGQKRNCGLALSRCRSHLDKLSGPLLDRFQVIIFSEDWRRGEKVPLSAIAERVGEIVKFRDERGQKKANAHLTLSDLEPIVDPFVWRELRRQEGSHRRGLAELRVARTFADLDRVALVEARHFEAAHRLSSRPFELLKRAYF